MQPGPVTNLRCARRSFGHVLDDQYRVAVAVALTNGNDAQRPAAERDRVAGAPTRRDGSALVTVVVPPKLLLLTKSHDGLFERAVCYLGRFRERMTEDCGT
jgi:hypothetical protein